MRLNIVSCCKDHKLMYYTILDMLFNILRDILVNIYYII